MEDQVTIVWKHVKKMKYIEEKWLTSTEVEWCIAQGKHGNSAWARSMCAAIDAKVEVKKHPTRWQVEMKELDLSWSAYWIMDALRKEPTIKPGELHIAYPESFKPGLKELEARGFIVVERTSNQAVKRIVCTHAFPERRADGPTGEAT
jgi:hypothetical protein